MTSEFSYVELMLQASLVVQLAMVLLILMSTSSWFVIVKKLFAYQQARQEADRFEDDFWSGIDLTSLYNRINRQDDDPTGMGAIFHAGFQEFLRLRHQTSTPPETVVDSTRRAMQATLIRETEDLEQQLPMLATIGSIAPYVGLFGTVWGVMNAFRALGAVQQATLAQVAPGISEALVTTAVGLFAAIPAVMAYNRYTSDTDRLANRFESFMDEFCNIIQRQAYSLRNARLQEVPKPAELSEASLSAATPAARSAP